MQEIFTWLISTVSSAGFVLVVGWLGRELISNYLLDFAKLRIEKNLEIFRGEIRASEVELDQIRSFLITSKSDSEASLRSKRFEAAECLLRARQSIAWVAPVVEYVKILDIDELMKDDKSGKNSQFIKTLIDPFNLDERIKEIGSLDLTLPRLYLGEKTLLQFEIYKEIVVGAVITMKVLSVNIPQRDRILKKGSLSEKIIRALPNTEEDFKKFGESYAFYWCDYFYQELLKSLRHEVSGVDDIEKGTDFVGRIAIDSRLAKLKVQEELTRNGMPSSLIKA